MPKHAWYERLFFYLQLREKFFFGLVLGLTLALGLCQLTLIFPEMRKTWVLVERFEGSILYPQMGSGDDN